MLDIKALKNKNSYSLYRMLVERSSDADPMSLQEFLDIYDEGAINRERIDEIVNKTIDDYNKGDV